jgi:Domain of unknown function (DUF4397)
MKTTNCSKFLAVALVATSVLFTSCGKDPVVTPDVVKNYAKVMLFHGATDAAAVNLQIDGVTKNLDSLKYGSATAYNQVEVVGKKIVVGITGAKTGAKIAIDSLLMNKDIGYSYFVYQESDAAKTVAFIKSVDDLAAPTAGKGRVRLIHLISDLSAGMDVELAAVGASPSNRSDFTNVKFKDIKNFIDIPAGKYQIRFKLTGFTNDLLPAKTFLLTVADGKLYTVVARGFQNKANSGDITTINNN